MKICIVSFEYPPFYGGGIGTYAAITARFLAEGGHEVYVIANRWSDYGENPAGFHPAGSPPKGTKAAGPHVTYLNSLTREHTSISSRDDVGDVCRRWGDALYWSLKAAEALEALHRRVGLDVVEFPECFAEAYVTLCRRRTRPGCLDVPVVITLHSPAHEIWKYNNYSIFSEKFQRRDAMEEYCIRRADALTSPTHMLAGMVSGRLGLDPAAKPVEIIRYALDVDSFPVDVLREGKGPRQGEGPPRLLYVGRVEPRKGCQDLIDAAVRVMGRHPHVRVTIVGEDRRAAEVAGSMREFLLRRIPEGLRMNFEFEGLMPRERLLRFYPEATACVFPAPWDNYPFTCCEAMASGACVIGSANSGMAEMIEHGASGLLFPAGDVRSLSETIGRALEDRALRETLGRNAPSRIRFLSDPREVIRRKVAHYARAIEAYWENRRVVAPPRIGRSRIAVFVSGVGDSDTERTTSSIRIAASRAGIDVDITTTRREDGADEPAITTGGEGSSDRLAGDGPFARWLERTACERPGYLMRLDGGSVLGGDFFRLTCAALDRDPVGWATTWARPASGHPSDTYAGIHFSLPLDLMFHRPAPFAVIREDAFRQVGGWNLDLPGGWREWDLWLAFHQAGWEGMVVAEWSAEYRPPSMLRLEPPEHPDELRLILERVVRRNYSVLSPFATLLWMNQMMHSSWSPPPVSDPRGDTSLRRKGKRLLNRLRSLRRAIRIHTH